jgi:hypothetical protein
MNKNDHHPTRPLMPQAASPCLAGGRARSGRRVYHLGKNRDYGMLSKPASIKPFQKSHSFS